MEFWVQLALISMQNLSTKSYVWNWRYFTRVPPAKELTQKRTNWRSVTVGINQGGGHLTIFFPFSITLK